MKKLFRLLIILSLLTLIGCSKRQEHTKGRFVFSSMRDGGYAQYLYRDGKLKALTEDAVCSTWSLDGKRIANCASSQKNYEDCKHIYLFDEYGNPVRTIDIPVGVYWLDWTPNGKKIIYVGYPSRKVNAFTPNLIYVYDFKKDEHKKIYEGEEKDHFMCLRCSPKGDRTVFYNTADTERKGTYVIDIGGENLKHINRYVIGPSWFPDGEHICVYGWQDAKGNAIEPEGKTSYFKYNIETEEYEKLLDDLGFCSAEKISRDGKYLYLARQQAEGRVINVVPLYGRDKGKLFPVVPNGTYGYDGYPDWYQG